MWKKRGAEELKGKKKKKESWRKVVERKSGVKATLSRPPGGVCVSCTGVFARFQWDTRVTVRRIFRIKIRRNGDNIKKKKGGKRKKWCEHVVKISLTGIIHLYIRQEKKNYDTGGSTFFLYLYIKLSVFVNVYTVPKTLYEIYIWIIYCVKGLNNYLKWVSVKNKIHLILVNVKRT